MNRISLGDDSAPSAITIDDGLGTSPFGPLPNIAIDPNLLLAGVGLLAFAFLWRGASRKVSGYSSQRRRRSRKRKLLKRQLRNL